MTRDPSRRVRFVLDGLHPSPVSTSSTLSSPGPATPQQLFQPLVRVQQHSYSSTPSPPIPSNHLALVVPCTMHPDLLLPTFDFDVSFDPAHQAIMQNNPQLHRIRDEPATNPPVSSLTLVSSHLPWEIVILPSAHSYVTISDVLGGLYRNLRSPAREEEYCREISEKQNAISLAFYNRFERHVTDRELGEREKQKGVKRIDFLAGVHRFRGLSKTERPNVWNVKFKL